MKNTTPTNATPTIEKPVVGYIVVTVALLAGVIAANAFGQARSKRTQAIEPNKAIEMRIVPQPRRWVLGVRADATDSGYVVRSVERHTQAAAIGLEPGDRIVAINGQQVGYLGTRLQKLSSTLDQQGGQFGRVRLLVQDRRNQRLVSMKAKLRSPLQQMGF